MISENTVLLHAIYMGIYLSMVYDICRIGRKVCPHNTFFVSLEDLLYWIYAGCEVFLFLDRESRGCLRWFAVLGGVLGIFLYEKICSEFIVKYISLFISFLLVPIKKVVAVFYRRIEHMRFRKRMKKEIDVSGKNP